MEIWHALVLSVVEGVTEFLPISSTGHLILASKLLNIPQTEFLKSFEIIIQSGAILAVAMLFAKEILTNRNLSFKVLASFLPTAALGLIFYKIIKNYLLENIWVVLISLLVGGIALVLIEIIFKDRDFQGRADKLSLKKALAIGVFQSFSMIPGVSRSAATIVGSMLLGLSRQEAVKYSFLLAIPTMAAATGLDFYKNRDVLVGGNLNLLGIGFIGSFLFSLLVIKWFLKYIQNNSFILFGIYRIILALVFWIIYL